MDRQFDFRALLLKIQDRLSNDDRHRLHFLVGDIIPRMQRENVTLAGTLTLLESLFDRAVINEDYLDFLIRIFSEIQCYDAVKRLQEYQSSKEPSKDENLTVSHLLSDNIEEDKHQTIPYDQLASEDSNSIPLDKLDTALSPEKFNLRKLTTTDPLIIAPGIPGETTDKFTKSSRTKSTPKKFFKLPLIYFLYILFFLEILLLIVYLWVFIRKKLTYNIVENRYRQEAYVLKNGKFPDGIHGRWFNHSEDLLLTYTDRLVRIDAYVSNDDMYSIKFLYSQNKSMEHTLKNITLVNPLTLSSLDFEQRNVQEITQCYKSMNQSLRLVGLFFAFKDKSSTLLGSCHEQIFSEDKFSNHIFGYASGKAAKYLNGFQFTWYKICPIHNRVTFCTNHDSYTLKSEAFYKN